jgi:uncharacterized protein YkwD
VPNTPARAVCFLVGIWLALALLVPLVASGESLDASLQALETELYVRVNAVRAEHHLVPLQRDPAVDRVARAQAADMAARGYLSHDNPEGLSPVDRLERGGVRDGFTLAAENAGKTNRGDPNREILEGWIASEAHRRNLFFPPFNTTGLGIARAADGTYVYVQLYLTYPQE